MNAIRKKVLAAAALLSIGGNALGYSWTFVNMTDKYVVIHFKLEAWEGLYLDIVAPGNNSYFEWKFGNPRSGHCLDFVRLANYVPGIFGYTPTGNYEADRAKFEQIKNDGSDYGGQHKILHRLGLKEVSIKWLPGRQWDMFSGEAQKAATELATGVGKAVGKGVDAAILAAATAATGGAAAAAAPVASKVSTSDIFAALGSTTGGFMKLLNRSKCMSRFFFIIDVPTQGGLMLVTQDK
jgi:hypothetical protein